MVRRPACSRGFSWEVGDLGLSPRKRHELSGLSSECSSHVCTGTILTMPTTGGVWDNENTHGGGHCFLFFFFNLGLCVFNFPVPWGLQGHWVGARSRASCVSGESFQLLRRFGGWEETTHERRFEKARFSWFWKEWRPRSEQSNYIPTL